MIARERKRGSDPRDRRTRNRILLGIGVMIKKLVLCLWIGPGLIWGPGEMCGQGGVQRLRYLEYHYIPFGLSRAVEIMGDRLLGPGKERIEWIGTLNPMDSGEVAVRIIWEFPRKVRIEKQLGPEAGRNVEVTVYDGENLRKSHGLAKPEDEDLVEMLTHDSVEGLFVGQIEGFSARFLGSGYREQDESGNPIGPSYDIYSVSDWFNVSGRYFRQRKLYYFDSLTAVLKQVQYTLDPKRGSPPKRVRIQLAEWKQVGDQLILGRLERYEDGVEVLSLSFTEATVGRGLEDGIFSRP